MILLENNTDYSGLFSWLTPGLSLGGILVIIGMWMIFTKAGEAGWKAIIPLYNTYLLTKIAMGNGWLFLLLLIPVVNVIFAIYLMYKLALAFGRGIGTVPELTSSSTRTISLVSGLWPVG